MRDLELRGAGNLLGDEQSGHVAALGFELYMQMLDEAVREMDPEEDGAEPPEPVRLDINVDAYVPGGLHPVRAGQGRRAPAHRGRARERPSWSSCGPSSRTASARSRSRWRT